MTENKTLGNNTNMEKVGRSLGKHRTPETVRKYRETNEKCEHLEAFQLKFYDIYPLSI